MSKVLFICGSLNQTTQMHQIARQLPAESFESFFSPYYVDGPLELCRRLRLLDMTVVGPPLANRCIDYLSTHQLPIELGGKKHRYDLVFICQDLVVPQNIRGVRKVLVQEGMTDPANFWLGLVKRFRFIPRRHGGDRAVRLVRSILRRERRISRPLRRARPRLGGNRRIDAPRGQYSRH